MSDHQTSPGTVNVTSSLGSGHGPTPCGEQGFPTNNLFGQGHVPASRSASLDLGGGSMMTDTSGLTSTNSSRHAGLQCSMESRLRARLASTGCTMYGLTWKELGMRSGQPICRLRASVLRTSDSDSIGWPTPSARDFKCAPTKSYSERGGGAKGESLSNMRPLLLQVRPQESVRFTGSGETLTGSSAGMDAGGQLNQEHSRWLMGLPPEWSRVAPPRTRGRRGHMLKGYGNGIVAQVAIAFISSHVDILKDKE